MVEPGALGLDFLTNIVNVHWGGGTVFVIGDDSGQIWRCVLDTIDDAPNLEKMDAQFGENNYPPDLISPGAIYCGSYALIDETPTFVLGGIDYQFGHYSGDGTGRNLYAAALVKASNDGTTWDTVYSFDPKLGDGDTGEARTPTRMIWDDTDKKFYLNMDWRSPDIPGVNNTYAAETWASPNGRNWTRVDSIPMESPGSAPNTSFDVHCKYKWGSIGQGLDGTGLANGLFGVDPSKKGSTEPFHFGHVVDDGLLITVENMRPTSFDLRLNFAGGLWGRNTYDDSSIFEVSDDDANTWKRMGKVEPYSPDDPTRFRGINIICAGGLKSA